jgi:hypothetical protein
MRKMKSSFVAQMSVILALCGCGKDSEQRPAKEQPEPSIVLESQKGALLIKSPEIVRRVLASITAIKAKSEVIMRNQPSKPTAFLFVYDSGSTNAAPNNAFFIYGSGHIDGGVASKEEIQKILDEFSKNGVPTKTYNRDF